MWAGLAKSFVSLLAARTFMGIAVAPSDTSMCDFLPYLESNVTFQVSVPTLV